MRDREPPFSKEFSRAAEAFVLEAAAEARRIMSDPDEDGLILESDFYWANVMAQCTEYAAQIAGRQSMSQTWRRVVPSMCPKNITDDMERVGHIYHFNIDVLRHVFGGFMCGEVMSIARAAFAIQETYGGDQKYAMDALCAYNKMLSENLSPKVEPVTPRR